MAIVEKSIVLVIEKDEMLEVEGANDATGSLNATSRYSCAMLSSNWVAVCSLASLICCHG